VACHISHYHGPATLLVRLVDDARRAGTDLTFDTYPYRRGCSLLAMVALPDPLNDLGVDAATRELHDPDTRTALVRDWLPRLGDRHGLGADWAERITLTHVAAPDFTWAAGHSLQAAADRSGTTPAEFIADVLAASRMSAGAIFQFPPLSTSDHLGALLRHAAHVAGSDGIYVGSRPHPRAWGTFARLLRRHTGEGREYTWAAAAHHLAGHTAHRFGLAQRGLVRRGYAADLAIVDPARVTDRATYAQPRQPADGIDDVIVNGEFVLRDGHLTGVRSGRGLRRGQ
jgi:N-acyl-D-amino-acid deacylase